MAVAVAKQVSMISLVWSVIVLGGYVWSIVCNVLLLIIIILFFKYAVIVPG